MHFYKLHLCSRRVQKPPENNATAASYNSYGLEFASFWFRFLQLFVYDLAIETMVPHHALATVVTSVELAIQELRKRSRDIQVCVT